MRAEPWGLVRTDHVSSTIRCTPKGHHLNSGISGSTEMLWSYEKTFRPGQKALRFTKQILIWAQKENEGLTGLLGHEGEWLMK